MELYYPFYGRREPFVQRFEEVRDYQAESWPHARRIVAKIEGTPQGSQRRFVVTNLPDRPEAVYRDFYVQRGAVPEQPIGEMKNGLRAERLSACGFCANSFRLLVHVVAYAIVVLFREATAAVPEVATAAVGTLRQRLWKVGAVVVTGARRIWLARVGDVAVSGPVGAGSAGGAGLRGAVAGEGRHHAWVGRGCAHVRKRAKGKQPGRLPASRVRAGGRKTALGQLRRPSHAAARRLATIRSNRNAPKRHNSRRYYG